MIDCCTIIGPSGMHVLFIRFIPVNHHNHYAGIGSNAFIALSIARNLTACIKQKPFTADHVADYYLGHDWSQYSNAVKIICVCDVHLIPRVE